MAIANADRTLVKVLHELAVEYGVRIQPIGEGWIYQLVRDGVVRHIYGYSFDLNTAATHQIACDKCATSEVLASRGLPQVPHHLFLHPNMARYIDHKGNWPAMIALCEKYGWDIVIKENTGTGGRGVLRVRNAVELENAVYTLFARTNSIAISPYRDATTEVRFIMLDGACRLAFAKVRPSVIGDGRSTALELLAAKVSRAGMTGDIRRLLENLEEDAAQALAVVPSQGAEFLVNWRHNLGQGAAVRVLEPDDPADGEALQLATRAAEALNLTFGSVDVLLTRDGPKVLEINAGVMMEFLARSISGGEELSRRIYREAFSKMFEVD